MAGLKQVKISIGELVEGMYVAGLDRPWSQTPFPLQGFYIKEDDEIDQLRLYCKFVYIDVQRGKKPLETNLDSSAKTKKIISKKSKGVKKPTERERATIQVAPIKIRHDHYQEVIPLRKETKNADQLHNAMEGAIDSLMRDINDGKPIQIRQTKAVANSMVESVIRNPDAFSWLARVKEKDEYTYGHVIRSSIWAMIFGRHVGLDRKDMNLLVQATLLKDVGKVELQKEALLAKERTPEEQEEYQKFVGYSVESLRDAEGVLPHVISIVENHCERFNGSGFPRGLRGDKIPFLSKVVGIVTVYDEITNPRQSKYPLAPSKAMSKLYEMRDIEFQEELVVQFIQALGIYPTGTLVELNTGEAGVVVEQTFKRRLKPKVMIVLDKNKKHLKGAAYALDLYENYASKMKKVEKSQRKNKKAKHVIEIVKDLEPGSYEIDIASIRDDYLKQSLNWRSFFSFVK